MNKKVITIIPDSFKDSLTSEKVAAAIKHGLKLNKKFKECEIKAMPFSDGGEGSLEVLKNATKTKLRTIKTYDSLLRKANVKVGYNAETKTGYIEMAQICGLQMLKSNERNPMFTTTFGIGEAIKKIINNDVKQIVIFIGGSSTNDAGCGLMQSLGIKFYDKNNELIRNVIAGKDLINIDSFDDTNIIPELKKIEFLICSDVTNKLYGKEGAAFVYGKQKGANDTEIEILNNGLENISKVYEKDIKKKISKISGSGAAGGVAFSFLRFFNTKIVSGSEYLSNIYELDKHIKSSSLIITGEGKLDNQSFSGKLVSVIYNKAKKFNKNVVVACGDRDKSFNYKKYKNIQKIVTVMNENINEDYAINNAYTLLKNIFKKIELNF